MPRPPSDLKQFSSLLRIVADLRGPEGCPWDKEQTHQSLSSYTVEESYELAEVLDQFADSAKSKENLDQNLKDELGDVLFQVLLHSQLAAERNSFTIDDVIENLAQKLVRRHPHVFSDTKVNGVEDVWSNWERIKAQEKAKTQKTIFDFPKALPALQRAYKIGVKTQKQKFDWHDLLGVQAKYDEEWSELQEALKNGEPEAISDELGDVLFTLAQYARHVNIEPEQALRNANSKFESRFDTMMKLVSERRLNWLDLADSEKEELWSEAKKLCQPK